MYSNRIWSWSDMTCDKHGPRTDVTTTLITRFMGPTWGPCGADRTQVGPMLAPWTLLSRKHIGLRPRFLSLESIRLLKTTIKSYDAHRHILGEAPFSLYVIHEIENNARVTVNNDFLVTSAVICQWFSRVTKSRVKIIGKSPHEWPENRYSR